MKNFYFLFLLAGFAIAQTVHVPTAGATESFTVQQGDIFTDPGGQGDGGLDNGAPGNYPNCGCITTTTLNNVSEFEFTFFQVFSEYDWLKIYDGTDTTGTIIFDNSADGSVQELDDIITEYGSAIFTSTTGSLTFEFRASFVVDYGGWEALITDTLSTHDLDTELTKLETYIQNNTQFVFRNLEIENAQVYNANGQLLSLKFQDNKIDIQQLEKGVYFVVAQDQNGKLHKTKFLKK